jgi:hypothetical protein
MHNEHFGNYTPRPPRCPSCARIMWLVRASRFGDLYIQYVFECRACGVSHIDAVEIEAAQISAADCDEYRQDAVASALPWEQFA